MHFFFKGSVIEGPLLKPFFFPACPVAAPPSVKKRRATVHKSHINGLIRKTERAFQRLESRFSGPLRPLFLPQVAGIPRGGSESHSSAEEAVGLGEKVLPPQPLSIYPPIESSGESKRRGIACISPIAGFRSRPHTVLKIDKAIAMGRKGSPRTAQWKEGL